MGTSHRQAPVRDLVGRVRARPRRLFGLPDGYEVALGNGGTTAFWDAAAAWLVRERRCTSSYGEFSQKFAKVDRRRALPRRPDRGRGRARRRARAGRRPGRRCDRLGAQRDLDRRDGRGRAPRRRRRRAGPRSTPPRAPAGCRSTPARPTPTTSPRRRPSAPTAASGSALLSPAAIERIAELDGAAGRWQPAFLSLQTALENSRKDQTYNTPARRRPCSCSPTRSSGCWRRRPRLRVERTPALLRRTSTAGPRRRDFATPFVADPAKRSLVVGTIDFDDSVDAAAVAATLRANGIVDVEPYRKLGRNQLRIGMFPAVEPADVEALTACIDWVVENVEEVRP